METRTIKKITIFNGRNTKVKVEILDGTYWAEGEGRAHCADGDDFDEETGEEIAEIRARLKAFDNLIEIYENVIQEKKNNIKFLQQDKKNLQKRLDYLIED